MINLHRSIQNPAKHLRWSVLRMVASNPIFCISRNIFRYFTEIISRNLSLGERFRKTTTRDSLRCLFLLKLHYLYLTVLETLMHLFLLDWFVKLASVLIIKMKKRPLQIKKPGIVKFHSQRHI